MIPLADYHVHTTFSDGAHSPGEVAEAACALGLTALGFSDHSHTAFDESWCMPNARIDEYKATVRDLGERYAGKMRVLCGIEQDYYSEADLRGFDYVIGSVHYVKAGESYLPVDETPELLLEAARVHFGGDLLGFIEDYYETVAQVVRRTGAGIVGHLDLIAKFNEGDRLFDSTAPRYRRAWQMAADRLLPTGALFEINFGAISRGYRKEPYPSREIRDYLADRGARFILSSDSHRKETLCYGFTAFDTRGLTLGGIE